MQRGISPVVGVALLAFLTILLALTVGAAVPSLSDEPPPRAQLSVSANASADRIAITHHSGSALDVTDLRVAVAVDGTELTHQPPVPFFAARGFRIASTNNPTLDPGATVAVTVATDRTILLDTTTTAT
ncbi:type IV pilin [Halobacteriales archaeon SW_7_65_23]|nr:MAG: type IV pilin [Halobacteriales archaeon SW_7_65_23]